MRSRASAMAGGLALALVVGACSDSNSPSIGSITNAAGVSSDVTLSKEAFNTGTFKSFGSLDQSINLGTVAAPPAVRAAARVLAATRPSAEDGQRQPGKERIRRALAYQQLANSLVGAQSVPVIPPTALGKTFEFDTVGGLNQYADLGTAGAPANGIRVVLYAVDPLTGQIALPINPVGYVDLIDKAAGVANQKQLQVVIVGVNGQVSTTYADYTVDITLVSAVIPVNVTASATGFVSDGNGHTLTFTLNGQIQAQSQTQATVNLTTSLALNSPAITSQLTEQLAINGNSVTFTIDYHLTTPENDIRVQGTVTADKTDATGTLTVNLTVTANGGTFATISGLFTSTSATLTITGPGGRALTAAEGQALRDLFDHLFDSNDNVFDHVARLIEPAFELLKVDLGPVS